MRRRSGGCSCAYPVALLGQHVEGGFNYDGMCRCFEGRWMRVVITWGLRDEIAGGLVPVRLGTRWRVALWVGVGWLHAFTRAGDI